MSGNVEAIKQASRHLRGTLAEDLAEGGSSFTADNQVLLKFHGVYQQDDRDVRRARAAKRLPLDYSCMVRAAVPGGLLAAEQWLALDEVADVAGGSLRLTTRQGVQYHTVAKQSLRPLIGALNEHLVTTLAACGDVVRNTMACPAPHADGRQAVLRPAVDAIVARFRPRTRSYWELWVDGEPAATAEAPADEEEPVYGSTYLPRKFKIGLAWPGDNCVDVHSQDVGLVPTLQQGTHGELTGWVVLVGGGLGMSHAREDDTYPRLATPLCWVEPERVVDVVEAVVTLQRDHGERSDRHRARLKYLVDERGIAWVRSEVGARVGGPVHDPRPLPPWGADDHHGWSLSGDGTWALGVPVASGRVVDTDKAQLRTALRLLVSSGRVPEIRVTPRQDVLLSGIDGTRRDEVVQVLRDAGVSLADDLTAVRRLAVACPALPTCGQALGEAERALPAVVEGVDKALAQAGLAGASLRLNMTGCPNGCARPYTAEVGIVGRTKTAYDVYLGGAVGGDRLAVRVRTDVRLDDVPELLQPVLHRYASEAGDGESFGDFVHRIGADTVTTWLPTPNPRRRPRPESTDGEGE